MPIPLDPRKKAAGIKVHISTGAGVDIAWTDGHASHYDFAYLRDLCPCALCDDERHKKQDMAAHTAGNSNAALPLFKPRPSAKSAKPMGNYALQIEFTDGHASGIYSYDYLRTICPCDECASVFRAGAN